MSEEEPALVMWAIYHGARDMPAGLYRLRRLQIFPGKVVPDHLAQDFTSLEDARKAVPAGLHRKERHPGDEPQIVEVWV